MNTCVYTNLLTLAFCPSTVDNEVDPCERYNDECRRLHCPYGMARSYNADNCEQCSCEEPCAQQRCPSGTECAVDLQSDPTDGGTVFVAICRPTSKPGECPRLVNATVCQDACRTDADCRNDNKCCQAGCATVCVPPAEPLTERPPYGVGEPAPPVLEPVPEEELDIKSEEGGIATLRCYATGFPPPSIRWKKGEVVVRIEVEAAQVDR